MAFHTPEDPGYAPGQKLRFNEGFSDDLDATWHFIRWLPNDFKIEIECREECVTTMVRVDPAAVRAT